DKSKNERAKRDLGIEIVDPEKIYDLEVDVFSPCALGRIINDETIDRLNCKIIGGAANNQLEADSLAETLHERGIIFAPDFIIGAGGLINVCNEIEGSDQSKSFADASKIYDKINKIIEISEEKGTTTLDAAMVMARQRLDRVKRLRGLI
ncbi:MAG: leucine dehydrogenase, partial [candidate division Zixibacteria bacterium]|nr:leucine dehydrogenase [candidate division Zixibacteria bacterium]